MDEFKITLIRGKEIQEFSASTDEKITDVLFRNDVFFLAPCGGNGTCGKCKVKLISGETSEKVDEQGLIRACKAKIMSDIVIESEPIAGSGLDIDLVKKRAKKENEKIAFHVFNDDKVSFVNAAADIGTTTIAVYLLRENGDEIAKKTTINPQGGVGADVLTRIAACNDGRLVELNRSVIIAIEKSLEELVRHSFKNTNSFPVIRTLAVAGNTTMLHLFMNVSPQSLGYYPFKAAFLDAQVVTGLSLGFHNVETVKVLPSISGFVGGDITAGIFATDLINQPNSILVDVGTNGEMVANHDGELFCCSTAAGPALEGANISCGSGGIDGAIGHIHFANKKLRIAAIGDVTPAHSICGSGLIDAIAVLLDQGLIDDTGLICKNEKSAINRAVDGDKIWLTDMISITQADIRQVQLAKSAVCAGLETLIERAKITKVNKVFLAGGLGYFLRISAAVRIGLIPKRLASKIEVVGNTAGLGAKSAATLDKSFQEMRKIASQANTIELSNDALFTEKYIDNMFF